MSRAIERQLARLEGALQLSDDGSHAGQVWASAEQVMAGRKLMCELVEGLYATMPDKLAAVRERLALDSPAEGHWAQAATVEERRVLREHIALLKAPPSAPCPWAPTPLVLDLPRADYALLPARGELRGRPTEG